MWRPPLAPGLLWQSWLLCWLLGLLAARWPGPALCAGLCVLVADSRLWRIPRLLTGCAVALLGCVTAQALLPAFPVPPVLEQLYEERTPPRHWPVLEARVNDVRTLPGQRLRISLTDLQLQQPDGQTPVRLPGNLSWTWEQAAVFPLPGQTVRLQRKLLPVDNQRNFGLTDWGFWWHSHGTGWRIWSRGTGGQPSVDGSPSPFARQRLELIRQFLAVLLPGRDGLLPPAAASAGPAAAASPAVSTSVASTPSAAPVPQGKAILLALLFGERFLLEAPTVQAFNAGNLSHSLALSGQHLLVAGLAGMFIVWLAAHLHPELYLWRPRTVLIPLAACPAALAYLWLGNAPPSLLRAAGMLLLLATGMALAHLRCMPLPQTLRERLPSSGLDVLCCTLLCITVISPLSVFDTGLQLSALCVAVICCATPLMGQLLRRIPRASPGQRLLRSLASILLVSFFIQLALLPLSLLLFNNSGLWFLLNVFWLPVLGALVLPGAFLGLGLSLCGLDAAATLVLDVVALPC
ncbi:ComEC/Rec2 family competence protein, partial [Desulfovibrio piger]|uniref:ComEC/Rec2 family competence protein n=1 Tax=Desulfovibrio piger TaxID=901 RepID=UPI003A8C931F